MSIHICFHNYCFDGAASAALFGRFYREVIDPNAECKYFGLTHRTGGGMDRTLLDAKESAILDFGFENTPALTWWFDHHQSAFRSEEDREAFSKDTSGKKFFDPSAPSCTGYIAKILKEQFDFSAPSFENTIFWADIIDAARFPDAETAVRLEEPALKLMTVIQGVKEETFLPRLIEDLANIPLEEVLALSYVQEPLKPLLTLHKENLRIVEERAKYEEGVVFFDLIESAAKSFSKFLPYSLFPDSRYCVGLTQEKSRVKISVGSNPWPKTPRTHNIADICKKYGGGGHAVVGAISLPPTQVEQGRKVYQEIIATLQGS